MEILDLKESGIEYVDLKVSGGTIRGSLIVQFFNEMSKKLSPYQMVMLLRKFVYGNIDFKTILESDSIVDERKLNDLSKQVNYYKKVDGDLRRKLELQTKTANDAVKARRRAEREAYEYVEAVRYYEDFLAGIKMRKEIIDRTKYKDVFGEEDEGWTT